MAAPLKKFETGLCLDELSLGEPRDLRTHGSGSAHSFQLPSVSLGFSVGLVNELALLLATSECASHTKRPFPRPRTDRNESNRRGTQSSHIVILGGRWATIHRFRTFRRIKEVCTERINRAYSETLGGRKPLSSGGLRLSGNWVQGLDLNQGPSGYEPSWLHEHNC